MRAARDYLEGLARLHRLEEREERTSVFRQSVATLAAAVGNQRQPVPLEGLDPVALLDGVGVALEEGLFDDLGWLSPPAAAAALYELAAALPPGDVKRELGRRVLVRLHSGDASTFVALATQLALGSARALSGPSVRSRVALCLDLPIGTGARVDGLALALISRRDLSREWLAQPSTGSLPSRRLAARLLERAAREAARRAGEGDDSGVRVFGTELVHSAWDRLLMDRESLVWRHVASARGLLSQAVPQLGTEIHDHLTTLMGVTEWRRAAASLATSIALRPTTALGECQQLLESELFRRDPGIAVAMMLGLPRAAEQEPAAVEELLDQLVRVGGLAAAEALVDLQRELPGRELGKWSAERARAQVRQVLTEGAPEDDGLAALMGAVCDDLADPAQRTEPGAISLRERIARALLAFAEDGPDEAARLAWEALGTARARLTVLESSAVFAPEGRRAAFQVLRELDAAVLETDALENLLSLARGAGRGEDDVAPLADVFQRLAHYLVLVEGDPIREAGALAHLTLRRRTLRTLLHLVDADGEHVGGRDDHHRSRRVLTARVLLTRALTDRVTPLHRTLLAAAARALDGLARDEIIEISDVLVAAGLHVRSPEGLSTMAEASMFPDIKSVLRTYAILQETVASATATGTGVRTSLDGLLRVANDLPVATSPRVEALRSGLLDFVHALEDVSASTSLLEVVEQINDTPLSRFEAAVEALARLVAGARRRLGEPAVEAPAVGQAVRLLDLCFERALRGPRDAIPEALASVKETLRADLPGAIADVAILALERLARLPLDAPRRSRASFLPVPVKEAPLPPWMPPGRTLGGFYVVRAIGAGAVGSVFVAKRAEEKNDPHAEQLALKVPDYSGAVARTLSEEQFLQVFRQEAGALLALPQHPNIARFVTFDVGARPKPILVMELVEGPSLERLLEVRDMSTDRALELLEGIATGLSAMHQVGVGHLDLKPSNIIIRDPDGVVGPELPHEPVLVDFGLAGRHLRPGCGTAEYGAPEVWTSMQDPSLAGSSSAGPVDVYAFACLAYEVLVGVPLFDGHDEMATIGLHLEHDGVPDAIRALGGDPRTARLARLLSLCLRNRPSDRLTIEQVRVGLVEVRPDLAAAPWPLTAGR